jgi:hypothetical protein
LYHTLEKAANDEHNPEQEQRDANDDADSRKADHYAQNHQDQAERNSEKASEELKNKRDQTPNGYKWPE